MYTLPAGAFAVLVSLGMTLAPGVAVADPSDSGSSSDGSSNGNPNAPGEDSPSGDGPSDVGPGADGAPGNGDPGGAPTSKLGSDPTEMSPADKADLTNRLAEIDAEVAEVVTLKEQVDNDPGFVPEAIALVDNEADELVNEQLLVHALAEEQGITAPPAATPALPIPPRYANMSLDQIMMQVNTDRQSMLDAQVRAQAAQIKVNNDKAVALNAQLQDPDLSQSEKDAIKLEIDRLASTSQLEMTQLQAIMDKFKQTTEGLSNWLSKDSQSKNTIVGNLR